MNIKKASAFRLPFILAMSVCCSCLDPSPQETEESVFRGDRAGGSATPDRIQLGISRNDLELNLKSHISSVEDPDSGSVYDQQLFKGEKIFYDALDSRAMYMEVDYPLITIEHVYLTPSFKSLMSYVREGYKWTRYNYLRNNKFYTLANALVPNEFVVSPVQYRYSNRHLFVNKAEIGAKKFQEITRGRLDSTVRRKEEDIFFDQHNPYLLRAAQPLQVFKDRLAHSIHHSTEVSRIAGETFRDNDLDNFDLSLFLLVDQTGRITELSLIVTDFGRDTVQENQALAKQFLLEWQSEGTQAVFEPAIAVTEHPVKSLFVYRFNWGFKNIE